MPQGFEIFHVIAYVMCELLSIHTSTTHHTPLFQVNKLCIPLATRLSPNAVFANGRRRHARRAQIGRKKPQREPCKGSRVPCAWRLRLNTVMNVEVPCVVFCQPFITCTLDTACVRTSFTQESQRVPNVGSLLCILHALGCFSSVFSAQYVTTYPNSGFRHIKVTQRVHGIWTLWVMLRLSRIPAGVLLHGLLL